ncbi:MAG: ccmG [Ilumatobacteraceae bacterium]|nr:ccmG [Ilumatobacteraceae bacterium]MCU1389853.1 ccmG [Ilumatobacteraceae bacterium]
MSDAPTLVEPAAGGDAPARSRRVAPIIVLVVTLVIAGFFVILVRAKPDSSDTAYSPLIGKPAPAVQAMTLDGKAFDLQHRKGSWVVLNFFNATCGPCVQEHPELVKFAADQKALGGSGAELYSVVWNDLDGGTADFFRTNKVSWPVLIDKDANIAVKFGVAKVPETWIIDPNGYVVRRVISNLTDDELTRYLSIDQAISAGGAANGTPTATS